MITQLLLSRPAGGILVIGYSATEIGLHPAAMAARGRQRLLTDSIGLTTIVFEGVPIASEIRVYLPSGVEVAGTESCLANQVLTWPVYASGNPNNVVRVVIVNLAYKLKDFLYTSKVGSGSIPIQMDNDPWFSNPL